MIFEDENQMCNLWPPLQNLNALELPKKLNFNILLRLYIMITLSVMDISQALLNSLILVCLRRILHISEIPQISETSLTIPWKWFLFNDETLPYL